MGTRLLPFWKVLEDLFLDSGNTPFSKNSWTSVHMRALYETHKIKRMVIWYFYAH